MDHLIEKLVPAPQQAHAQALLEDPDSRHIIRQQLSQLAEDHTSVLPQDSLGWILCKLSTFGADESDTIRIYQAFVSQLHQLGHMCRVLCGEGTDCRFDTPAAIANRITIGLGLFYEQAARHHKYHAAPSPQFYQRIAVNCFAITGYQTIAAKLPDWLEFIRANFILPRL